MTSRLGRIFLPRGFFTPRGLLVRGAVLVLLFGLVHLAGLREHTSVFSLTTPAGGSSESIALGSTYAVLYLLFTLVAPLFLLGGLLLLGLLLLLGRRGAGGAALLIPLLLGAPARANIAAPWSEGDPAADPQGDLRPLEILDEELALDLRPLATGEQAQVLVRYHLRNPGEARRWNLVFVTPGLAAGTVTLDGLPLKSVRTEERMLPERWTRGVVTPSLDGLSSTTIAALRPLAKTLSFEVATGARREHRIEVRYRLSPPARHRESLYVTHQVVYLLAPARQWGGFGTLRVRAQIPPGWRCEALPRLQRRGDELDGTFRGLPGESIAIALAKPDGLASAGWALPLLGALLALVLGWRLAGWLGCRLASRGTGLAVLGGLGVGLVAAAALVALPVGGLLLWERLLDATQVSSGTFYNHSMAVLLLGPPVALLWALAIFVTLLLRRRRARLAAAAEPRQR